jgi:1,4-dihydroxy-2-naphthoate octaprenyltransferase
MIAGGAKSWVLAARPKTLPAAVVPVWAGCVLVWKVTGTFDLGLALATLAGAVCIQIATNFFNDAIDSQKGADTEERIGPVRVTASGLMSSRAVLGVGALFLCLAIWAGVPLFQARGWMMVLIGVPSLFLAYGYTGGPFPLAYLGLGELFVILFFGVVAVAGTVFVQIGEWWGSAVLLGVAVGALSAILISINNLRDVEEDAQTGKRTLAVRWGWKKARWLVRLELLVASLAMTGVLLMRETGSVSLLMIILLLVIYFVGSRLAAAVTRERPSPHYNVFLKRAGLLLLGFGLVWQLVIF